MKKLLISLSLLSALCGFSMVSLLGQTYTISPPPFLLAQDNNGVIISGGCIWTYVAGTSTAATTYSDNLGTPNSNPIQADSAGRFTAYLIQGNSYKFVYEAACTPPAHGTVLRTADPISAMPSSSGNVDVTGTAGETILAGQVVYLSDGSGSKTTGLWYVADAGNKYSSTTPEIGIATSAIATSSTGTIRLIGRSTGLTALTPGTLYYVASTGAITTTPPLNQRLVGQADTTTSLVASLDPPPLSVGVNGVASSIASDGQLLIGRTSDHQMTLGNLSAGYGIGIVNSSGAIQISSGVFSHTNTTSANPVGTNNGTGLMMGLAGTITPTATGNILFCMSGNFQSDTGGDGAGAQLRFGSGTAPTNGAALTGTTVGTLLLGTLAGTDNVPFGACGITTGATINTALWYDIGLRALNGGIGKAVGVVLTAVELP